MSGVLIWAGDLGPLIWRGWEPLGALGWMWSDGEGIRDQAAYLPFDLDTRGYRWLGQDDGTWM